MVQAWYMDESDTDQRLPHQCDPPQPVGFDKLKELGVLYWKIEMDDAGEYRWGGQE